MSDELNVWRELFQEFQALRRASCLDEAEQEAAAVIRTYGDKRYQQAIADVVEYLNFYAEECDAWPSGEDYFSGNTLREAIDEITRRFGKDA